MLLLRRVAVLKLLPREELDQWHHRLPHISDAPLLLVDVGSVHNDPLQALKRQRLWSDELAKNRESALTGHWQGRDSYRTIFDQINQALRRTHGNSRAALLEEGDLFLDLEVLGELSNDQCQQLVLLPSITSSPRLTNLATELPFV